VLKVLVLARSPVIQHGIIAMLEREGFSVMTSTHRGFSDSVSFSATADFGDDPDVVVYDTVRDHDPERSELDGIPVVYLVARPPGQPTNARNDRATAWLDQDASRDELAAAVRAVAAGLNVYALRLDSSGLDLDGGGISNLPSGEGNGNIPDPLTPRESEVVGAVADGLTNKAIAHHLGISEHTVKYHVSSILTKLDVSGRTEAVTMAARLGLMAL
jgi:DNA-binding NarL/FixJ family response regulator